MRRFGFLTVFLTTLSIVFAIAVFLRIRSYDLSGAPPPLAAPTAMTPSHTTSVTSAAEAAAPHRVTTMNERARRREAILREAMTATTTATTTRSATTATTKTPHVTKIIEQPAISHRPPQPMTPHSATVAATETARDPNSDTTPPQLVAIEFDPPQIHDGEESRVILTAVDDLSGIRGISGTITSPTGKAMQGFSGTREGDTNRYVGRIAIPKNGEEGLWRVNVVSMSDNAANSVTLTAARGIPPTAVLRVTSSQSDSTPPVLKSVRPEKSTMHVGEPNPITIEAQDDQSGVNLVSAVFQSPNKRARMGAACRHADGNFWICDLSLPVCIDCGDWQLEQVTLQDKANNLATFRVDNPIVAAVKINIGGESCDSEPPRLVSVALDQSVVTLGRDPATVTVTVFATDDACGVEGVTGQYTGAGVGTGGFFPLQATDNNTFVGRIPLDPRAARGVWRITSIQVSDKGHNLRIYHTNDPLLVNATFQVR